MSRRVIDLLTVRVGGDMQEVLDGLDAIEHRAEKMGRKMTRVGKTLTAGITLPLAAVGAASVKMASDAEEAANKFDVVMGASAASARAELQQLMETIPATSAEMEGMAAGLQDLLVPMGVARQEAAGMSVGMVKLAGDIASFNNVLPTEALDAMRSALAGESEPMRRFGVDTRVARLEALALEEGLIGLGDELTETARAQAVMLAIQRDSTDAIGDAARTVDSTSNQMKFFARDVKQLAIEIGGILIPAVRPLIALANDLLQELRGLDPGTMRVVIAIGALAAAIGPAIIVVGTLVSSVGTLAGAFVALNGVLATGGIAAMVSGGGLILALAAAAGGAAWLATKLKEANDELVRTNEQASTTTTNVQLLAALNPEKFGELPGHLQALAEAGERVAPAVAEVARAVDVAAVSFREASVEAPRLAGGLDLIVSGTLRLTTANHGLAASTNAAADAQGRLNEELGKAQGFLGSLSSVASVFGIGIPGLGGLSSLLGSIPGFAGFFAGGGHIPAGQVGMVAEAGRPEVVSSPSFVRGPAQVTPMGGAGDTILSVSFVTPDGRQVADRITVRQKRGENLNRVIHLPVQVATG